MMTRPQTEEAISAKTFAPMSRIPLLAGLVGVGVGVIGVAFFTISHIAYQFLFGNVAGLHEPETSGAESIEESSLWLAQLEHALPDYAGDNSFLWMIVAIPAVGGLLVGLWRWLTRDRTEYGTELAIESYHSSRGQFAKGTLWKKFVASTFTLGLGGSGGREGPIAVMGAALGANVAERFHLTVRERRILLAAGIAAGVGGMFRAPLAGGLLAAEILYADSEFEPEVLIPAMLSSVASYCVFCLNFGWGSLLQGVAGNYTFADPLDLLPFAALAGAVVAAGYLSILVMQFTERALKVIPAIVRPAVGVGLAGAITLAVIVFIGPENNLLFSIMGDGYGGLQHILDGNGTWKILLILAAGKILTSALTIQSGGAAGFFAPSMVIGGAIGGAIGVAFASIMPGEWSQSSTVGVFALVGMAGYYAAVGKAPVSTVIMVSELTGSYHLLLPSMWVCTLAFILSRKFRLYSSQVESRKDSPAHRGDFATDVLEDIHVKDILPELTTVETVEEQTPLHDIIGMKTSKQAYYPVLTKEGRFTGIFSLNDLRAVFDEQEVWVFLVAADIAHTDVVTVHPSESLSQVTAKFAATQFEELPVVDDQDEHRLLGMISRRQLNSAYIRRMMVFDKAKADETTRLDAIRP